MTVSLPSTRPAGALDFDFLLGHWTVRHRRLRERLVGSKDWVEFDGTMKAQPILRGLGNFDQNAINLPGGRYEACTLRMFRADTSQWSIHWIDGRDPKLDAPLYGAFSNGTGTFDGKDTFNGRPIDVRFLWQSGSPETAHWEQAFSADNGATWEKNWMMDFTRVQSKSADNGNV